MHALANSPLRNAVASHPRNVLGRRYVYAVVSQRSGGLSVGINLSPRRHCNFNCVYCEVDRRVPVSRAPAEVDVPLLGEELYAVLRLVESGGLRDVPLFAKVPPESLRLKNVALSGDGEPTLCPQFAEVIEEILRIRGLPEISWFPLVLITNSSGLHLENVRQALDRLADGDEIWTKLDAGTESHMRRVNRGRVPLARSLRNILTAGRRHPVVIQSAFCRVHGETPPPDEIGAYVRRLSALRERGARIARVQIYSVVRPPREPFCGAIPFPDLLEIARQVSAATGLSTEVY